MARDCGCIHDTPGDRRVPNNAEHSGCAVSVIGCVRRRNARHCSGAGCRHRQQQRSRQDGCGNAAARQRAIRGSSRPWWRMRHAGGRGSPGSPGRSRGGARRSWQPVRCRASRCRKPRFDAGALRRSRRGRHLRPADRPVRIDNAVPDLGDEAIATGTRIHARAGDAFLRSRSSVIRLARPRRSDRRGRGHHPAGSRNADGEPWRWRRRHPGRAARTPGATRHRHGLRSRPRTGRRPAGRYAIR